MVKQKKVYVLEGNDGVYDTLRGMFYKRVWGKWVIEGVYKTMTLKGLSPSPIYAINIKIFMSKCDYAHTFPCLTLGEKFRLLWSIYWYRGD